MQDVKISVITATYNNITTIESTIKSVLSQTYRNIEYIIIDGASTDGTKELIETKYKNDITVFVSEPDEGMYHALNKGITMVTGDVIGFLHADDFYAANTILEAVAGKFANTDCDAVYGDLQYVYKSDETKILRQWQSGEYYPGMMKKGWMPPHPTLFVIKTYYEAYGLFDTSFKVAADYELMTRFLCVHNMKPAYIPKVFIKMRWGGKSNKSIKNIVIKMRDDYRAILKNRVGNIFTLLNKNFSKIGQFVSKK